MNSDSINLGCVRLHLTDKGDQEKNCKGEICSEKKLLRLILQKNDFPNDDTKNQPGRKKLGAFQLVAKESQKQLVSYEML